MSVRSMGVLISCDVAGCSRQVEMAGEESVFRARAQAAALGWTVFEGFDYCPDCGRLPDVQSARERAGGAS